MNRIHLICNAHLDPAWLWQWKEGAAEALSTFRTAADFCDQYDGFIFNHNEAFLYKWIEELDSELFRRIQALVRKGQWHIMGGWYLQPDCNMPSGESLVRQILWGRKYFKTKFDSEPTTAINFDPFGHGRGLVQILRKSGYDSYLVCRPFPHDCPLPADDFIWIGFDGTEIITHRTPTLYNSGRGTAGRKVENWMETHRGKEEGLVLWGIGNHGGGPSRIDLIQLKELQDSTDEYEIIHSTPEAYFRELAEKRSSLPRFAKALNPFAVGCYTSQIRVKQKHRQLENQIYMLEKMASSAALQRYLPYPSEEIGAAVEDLLFAEFHDLLPGSGIQPVEEDTLKVLDHGLEIIDRLKMKVFIALTGGEEKAREGEIPIFVYNPHPFPVKGTFECEFQLWNPEWRKQFALPVVYHREKRIPCQVEKELCNLSWEWRKRVVFQGELEPGRMNRFDCKIEMIPQKPAFQLKEKNGKINFMTKDLEVAVNCRTGLIDRYLARGVSYLKEDAFLPLVIEDNADPWGMTVKSFRSVAGSFRLMSREEAALFSGVKDAVLDSVRVIEDGEVRSVIEAVLKSGNSFICQHYVLPKSGTEMIIKIRVYWNEKDRMLKLSVPTSLSNPEVLGQVAYGAEEFPPDGKEMVFQKWVAVVSESQDLVLTCINDGIYGFDCRDGELRLSLLRSPAYSAHPLKGKLKMAGDRFLPRMDQGEREFTFWINGGKLKERIASVDREALAHNEKPFALTFNPPGKGDKSQPVILLHDNVIQMTAFKKCEDSNDYIIRLFEPVGEERTAVIELPVMGIKQQITLKPFEIKTLKLKINERSLVETDLMEKNIR